MQVPTFTGLPSMMNGSALKKFKVPVKFELTYGQNNAVSRLSEINC